MRAREFFFAVVFFFIAGLLFCTSSSAYAGSILHPAGDRPSHTISEMRTTTPGFPLVHPTRSRGHGRCYNLRQDGAFMGNLDVPEVLIIMGILGGIAWAIYNRRHPNPGK